MPQSARGAIAGDVPTVGMATPSRRGSLESNSSPQCGWVMKLHFFMIRNSLLFSAVILLLGAPRAAGQATADAATSFAPTPAPPPPLTPSNNQHHHPPL